MMYPSVNEKPVGTLNSAVLYQVTSKMAALKEQKYNPFLSPNRVEEFFKLKMTNFFTVVV